MFFKGTDCTSKMDEESIRLMEVRILHDADAFTLEMTLDEAFEIAGSIQCVDNIWETCYLPAQVVAAMLRFGRGIFEEMMFDNHREVFARRGAYDRCRRFIEARFPHIHANVSDPWGYETYSDLYKDRMCSRPRGHITGPEMRKWLKEVRSEDID